MILFVFVGLGLFVWVTVLGGVAIAFNILTQHESPIRSGLGPAGMLLSSFGFFVAPAIIGALVGAVYVSASQPSPRSIGKRMEHIESKLRPRQSGR
ncbi:hypothetical protein AWC05_00820 [Mycobacterium florentinum]|uniref:Uncharacterized protein n=1 Tax=Mycobacterium florentinum TaxID=292462 RepID=A0A1X1TYQ9_MYCFL|nr:hypothetical protein AWC05_00820 [Mycobacterium florentinum]